MNKNRRLLLFLSLLCVVMLLQGCAGLERHSAVPAIYTRDAVVPGLTDVRYRLYVDKETLLKEGIDSYWREVAHWESQGQQGPLPPANFLAISGGGDNGAFGAGLLNAWSETGTRPEFKLVTGVSTGALIAPFAFLGPKYDSQLRKFYTTLTPDDIMEIRSPLAAVTSDALADNKPLWRLVEKEIGEDLLAAIAGEYQKGRLLLIATVDLDSRQSILWNMTKIAASTSPKALRLFHSILIASSAIPGAFPPVMIDVEVDGKQYQEMHVDGGTVSQVFVYPPSLHVKETSQKYHVSRERKAYIIRNARLDPEWAEVERRTMSIVGRAISSLIQSQGIGDIYRIYTTAQRDGVDFNLAYIPESFHFPHQEEFDTDYMRALFETGYDLAKNGYPWEKTPPGF